MIKAAISDEELLQLVNKAVSNENERASKMKKTAIVNKVETFKEGGIVDNKSSKSDTHNPILNEIRELTAQLNEVTAMKTEIADLKKQMNERAGNSKENTKRKFCCTNCKKNNVRRCTRCFSCGGNDHVRAHCKGN